MSKIARIYQGLEEIQKYYQGGVLQRLFFDWKHYIGEELNIEYAKECAGRNVVISGKTTIQGVPSDYTILDYIECTGTQYIDTGFKANTTTTKFVGAFTPTQKVTGGLLGSRNATSSGTHACNVFVLAEGKFRVDWANGTNVNHTVTETDYVVGTKYEMEITRGTVVINGTTKSFSNRTSIDQLGNFLIGNFNNVNEPYNNGFIGYIHECKLYSNDVLIRDFIPVKRISDNVVGMYDIVTETFFTNAGTGVFVAGTTVVSNEIKSVAEEEDNTIFIKINDYIVTNISLPIPLRSLPNGVADTIEGNKLVQRVGKVTYNGQENWEGVQVSTNVLVFYLSNTNFKELSSLICDTYTVGATSKDKTITCGNAWRPKIRDDSCSTTEEFKQLLAKNPVTVYYELATPIETEITPDMILINGEPITDTVGIELPNGTKDSIEKGIYTKNINKIVLDGSADEVWIETNWSAEWGKTHNGAKVYEYRNIRSTSYVISTNQNNFLYESTDTTLSPYYETNYKTLPENAFMCKGNYIDFGCHFDTVEDFRNFLAENPFTIQYELATPIKIPLFSIKEGLTTLKSTNNITPQIELDCLVRDDFQNMCDNVWEKGNIDSSTGLNSEYGTRIRLKNFIKVVPNTNYRIDITNLVEINNVGYIGIRYYDLINNYINYFQVGNLTKSTFIFTTPEDCYYIRFIAETADTNFEIYLKEVIN